jgi:hypothetical protein
VVCVLDVDVEILQVMGCRRWMSNNLDSGIQGKLDQAREAILLLFR